MAYTFKHGDRPIDGLTIQRAVGRGGFGEVYYALTDSGKQIAVKYLRENAEIELRGIAHVMNLKSPHLITIYDVRHNDEGEPFVIMEYVSGPSLRDLLIAEPQGLGPQKAAFFLKGIAAGLRYLHDRGIVHRDLKPGNIFYDDGYVKIGDYGLSKHIAVSAHSGNTISVGTVHYMAPEIGTGSYTKSIDIYALGVMLYEMLTGRLPFTGSSMGEILMRHLRDQPDVTGIPEPFAGVIARALAKDPADRYQDVDEMVEALVSVTEIHESLASFDASVLTQGARADADAFDADRTLTTPPRKPPVPVLDAREALADLPPLPPQVDKKVAKKIHKAQQKLAKKARKLEKINARLEQIDRKRAAGASARPPARAWSQIAMAFFVLLAVSGGLALTRSDGEVFGIVLLYLIGGALGTLLGYRFVAHHVPAAMSFMDRVAYAATGFVCMLPAYAAASESGNLGLAQAIIPLTASLLLLNWTERIEIGRRQIIDGGKVFWHGVVGLFIASLFGPHISSIVAGVLCAALLVLVQTLAAARPVALPETDDTQTPPDAPGVSPAAVRGHPHARRGEAVAGAPIDTSDEPFVYATKPPQTPAATPEPESQRLDAMAAQPSFVGRATNAGLSIMAKLLLLAGLSAIALIGARAIEVDDNGTHVSVGRGRVVVTVNGVTRVEESIPPVTAIAPVVIGSILLLIARRRDGIPHFVRAFVGCGAAVLAVLVALGPAREAIWLVSTKGWSACRAAGQSDQFGLLIVLVLAALLLVFWPKRPRQPRPIVV